MGRCSYLFEHTGIIFKDLHVWRSAGGLEQREHDVERLQPHLPHSILKLVEQDIADRLMVERLREIYEPLECICWRRPC
jgi:hypothetical protein